MANHRRESEPSVWDAVVAQVGRWGWPASTAVVVLPALGALSVTLGQGHESAGDWWLLGTGTVLVVLAGLMQVLREVGRNRLESAQATEADRLRVLVKDALQPVAELIAEMPAMTPRRKEDRLKEVAQQAVGALTLLLKDVDRLRAIIYSLDPLGMSHIAYQGRGQTPRPFLKGTERGDLALAMVQEGRTHFASNITVQTPVAYRGTGSDYTTFISAAISNGPDAFGMVTVDAPNAGDLVDTDRQIVMLVADLLSIAFAIAVRPNPPVVGGGRHDGGDS